MPVLSAIIFLFCLRVSDAKMLAKDRDTLSITGWLEIRVLPGPPRSPTLTEISRGWTNTRGFAGRRASLQSLQGSRTVSEPVVSKDAIKTANEAIDALAEQHRSKHPGLTHAQCVAYVITATEEGKRPHASGRPE